MTMTQGIRVAYLFCSASWWYLGRLITNAALYTCTCCPCHRRMCFSAIINKSPFTPYNTLVLSFSHISTVSLSNRHTRSLSVHPWPDDSGRAVICERGVAVSELASINHSAAENLADPLTQTHLTINLSRASRFSPNSCLLTSCRSDICHPKAPPARKQKGIFPLSLTS